MKHRHPHRVASAAALGVLLVTGTADAQDGGPARSGGAAETVRLTVDDAVRRAVEHNPELAIVRLGMEVETARVAQARGAFTPRFSSVFGRSSAVTPPSSSLTGDRGVDVDDLFSSSAVRQRFPWGAGTWSVSWDAARTTSDNPISSFDPSLQSSFEVAFSQPLFKDFRIDAARHQHAIARRNEQSSKLRFDESLAQVTAAVKQSYWTLKAAIANIDVQQRSLDLAKELARENRIRVKAGQIPALDLVQAEAEVAERRENLIQATAAADDAEDRLRTLIMDPADASFWRVRLDPVEQPSRHGPLPDVDAAVATALQGRYDLARAGHDLDNARTDVEFLGNQKLPDVRLETSYRGSGLGGTRFLRGGGFPGTIIGTRRTSFGDALGQVFSPDYPSWSVGITVNYPLGRTYETASLARAEVERRQAAQRIASLRLETAETVRRAARQIRSASERMDAARVGADLAQERAGAEQRRYEVGLSTTFLVTQAQRDLVQAQVKLLQSSLDYESSLVNFEAVQHAPPLPDAGTAAVGRPAVVLPPTPSPRGVFRPGAGSGF